MKSALLLKKLRLLGCMGLGMSGLMLPLQATAQTLAPVETVSSGPVKAVVPTGTARPQRAAPASAIRVRETMTAAQLAAARSGYSGKKSSAAAAPSSSAPATFQLNFEGTAQTQSLSPPDTHGAVGTTSFVEVTNSKFEVYNRETGAQLKSVSLNSFCDYTPTTVFDPRVVYDKIWNRWVVVAEAFPESSSVQILCVAVSTTASATGSFFIYKFQAPRGAAANFYDYPMLGMDQDAIIITANIFGPNGGGYQFSNVMGIAKADLYNGRGFSVPVFNAGASGTLAPPVVETNDTPALILSSPGSGNTIGVYRASNLGRGGATLSARVNVSVSSFVASPTARQFGTSDRLDVLNRFQDHSTQISNHVLNTQTVNIAGFPLPRWWQINGNTNAQAATGVFYQSGSSDDFNPAIAGSPIGGTAANPIGRMFFTWTATEPSGSVAHNARVKGGGRLATDSATFIGGSTLFTSSTFYNPSGATTERWGDYASVTLDPLASGSCAAGNRAYIVNEKINSQTLWGSRFGRFGFC